MTVDLKIKVENGAVTMTVGGQSAIPIARQETKAGLAKAATQPDDVAAQKSLGSQVVGGSAAGQDSPQVGGAPASGPGVVVIGPIVLSGLLSGSGSSQVGSAAGQDSPQVGSAAGQDSPQVGGAPATASLGPGVLVIGPIVISGSGGQTVQAGEKIDNPLTPKANDTVPEFTMQTQQEDNWCWAAVGVAINNFLDPGSLPLLTQASLANKVLAISGVDCTKTPDKCNLTAALDDVLTVTANLRNDLGHRALDFPSLKAEIDGGFPICAQIDWVGGGAHAIALDGYIVHASGLEVVSVKDPLYGPSFQFYDDLVNQYLGRGVWADTFTVKS